MTTNINIVTTFPTWTSFTKAFTYALNSVDYAIEYPGYGKITDVISKADEHIVKELLANGYNPQEGFDSFVHACLDGTRYIKDAAQWGTIDNIIKLFIEHGVKITDTMIHILFTPTYTYMNIEDESPHLRAKGILIDTLAPHGIDISRYGNWSTIKATYWEDIPEELDFDIKFRMYLKDCSKYLQSLPIPV